MRKLLDKAITLLRRPRPERQPRGKKVLSPRFMLSLMLCILLSLTMNITPSKADMNLKLYAYNLLTWREFQCFNWLIHYESRWNPKARNGSHYGLGQMRSTWYRDLSPQGQINHLSDTYVTDTMTVAKHYNTSKLRAGIDSQEI